jgi:hypothetical protein
MIAIGAAAADMKAQIDLGGRAGCERAVHQGMVRQSGNRFAEKDHAAQQPDGAGSTNLGPA